MGTEVDMGSGEAGMTMKKEITLLDLFATLLHHRVLIIVITGLAALGALAVSIISLLLPPDRNFLPTVYTPKAVLLVNDSQSGGLSSMLASSGLGNLAGLAGVSTGKSYGELAVYIAKSDTTLDALIQHFSLKQRYRIKKSPIAESRKKLLEKYNAAYNDKTGILTLSYEDYDPAFARDLVNYAVELVDKRFTVIGGNRNLTRKEQLEGKLADVQAELNRIESRIQAFQQKYGVISIEGLATEQIQIVAKVRSELILKEMEIKTYTDISSIEDPALRRLKAERDNLSKLLSELEKGFSEYEDVMPAQKDLPKLAIEYSHLQRDLLVQGKIYELLIQQYELTKLSLAGEDPIIQILELAQAPDKKSGPSRGMICIVATMAGFFLSILLAFLVEAVSNIRRDPEAMAILRGAMK
jgi:uncharacterized protein involved in exopolysaccharide biosynthesis